ncbi:tRNA pseudouridine(55) synthase TruB [Pseudothermotoga thermarum]|uniref:tRNA pseudouridine synthase B n=1 Tax=Pseudothermotoga thermarum DSM 5069 TaxID=688269 RepID=F7YYL8_9THEM|nr:tRNA pseudouridine(55) synthase TruB [Pseudothermotoga thermarum]AEH51050.1 tRNA pseudouridine synthase B [Pseudothermotoga thermarum DSM 5069]
MNGILLVDKPKGPTSHDVVEHLRKKLGIRKIGHAGTLDPFATGLLIVGIGWATRILEYLMKWEKTYYVKMVLGLITDTFDITGQIVEQHDVNVDQERILQVINSFVGTYKQVPPAYSARKYKGKKLYELARQGKIIRLPPREVTIYEIRDVKINGKEVSFVARVSSGTYIRSLCMDIGYALGCGATAVELRRLKVGNLSVEDAIDVFNLEREEILSKLIDPVNILTFPKVYLSEVGFKKAVEGNAVRVDGVVSFEDFSKNDIVQVIYNGKIVCLAKAERNSSFVETLKRLSRNEVILRPFKVFKE